MASLVEQLTQVHVYLDSVHDASIKAIKFSQDRAVDLAKGFIEVQKEAPAEHRLTPPVRSVHRMYTVSCRGTRRRRVDRDG